MTEIKTGALFRNRYIIDQQLGAGSMGVVYAARDRFRSMMVAIKILGAHLMGNQEAVARFCREAEIASSLQSSRHFLQILEADLTPPPGEPYYIVMELLSAAGRTLMIEIETRGLLPIDEALQRVSGIAEGLAVLHSQGITHRDIKPENIYLRADQALILDFSIAAARRYQERRLTQAGTTMGTAFYMSPEQVRGEFYHYPPIDIYALGVVLYELLTGEPPFTGSSAMDVVRRHLSDPPPPLPEAVPMVVQDLVHRMLAKGAEHRPTAETVVRYISRLLAARPPGVSPMTQLADPLAPDIANPPDVFRVATGDIVAWSDGVDQSLVPVKGK